MRKITTGWITPVLAGGVVLVGGLLMAAALLGAVAGTPTFASTAAPILAVAPPIQQLLLAFGIVLGGGIVIDNDTTLSGTVGIASAGTIVLIAAGVYAATRWGLRRERPMLPSPRSTLITAALLRSLLEALPIALVMLLLAIFGRVLFSFMVVSPRLIGVLVTVWLTTALAMTLARLRGRIFAGWSRVGALVREPAWYLGITVAVMTVVIAIGLVVLSASEGTTVALAWLPYGATLGAITAALGQLGHIANSGGGSEVLMLWNFFGPASFGIFAIVLVTLLFLTIFIGARRGRLVAFAPGRVWQLPLGVFVFAELYSLTIGQVRTSGPAFGTSEGSVALFLSPLGALTIAAIALVASIVAEIAPGFVYRISPRVFVFLVGHRAAHAWVNAYPLLSRVGPPSFWPTSSQGYELQPGIVRNMTDTPAGAVPPPPGAAGHRPPLPPPSSPQQSFPQQSLPQQPFPATPQSPMPSQPRASGQLPMPPAMFGQPPANMTGAQPSPYGYAASAPPLAPLPPRQKMGKKAKRRIIGGFVTIGVLGLLAGGGIIALNIVNSMRGPEAAVEQYLSHIAQGDAEAAAAIVKPKSGGKASSALLTNDVMKAEGVERIQIDKVTSAVKEGSERGVVTAQLTLGGETFDVDIAVKQGPKEYGLLTTWEVSEAFVFTVNIETFGTQTLVVGSTPIELKSESDADYGSERFLLYPAIYPLEATAPNKFYQPSSTTVSVGMNTEEYVWMEVTLSDSVQETVLEQVNAFIASCTVVPTNMNENCPWTAQATDLASLEVTELPAGFTSFDDDSFVSERAAITTVQVPSTWNKTPKPSKDTFTVHGTWKIVDDEIVTTISDVW